MSGWRSKEWRHYSSAIYVSESSSQLGRKKIPCRLCKKVESLWVKGSENFRCNICNRGKDIYSCNMRKRMVLHALLIFSRLRFKKTLTLEWEIRTEVSHSLLVCRTTAIADLKTKLSSLSNLHGNFEKSFLKLSINYFITTYVCIRVLKSAFWLSVVKTKVIITANQKKAK